MLFGETPLADQVVLTPAERAVLVEQAESCRVQLDLFISQCKDGEVGDAVRSFIDVRRSYEYMCSMLTKKIKWAMQG